MTGSQRQKRMKRISNFPEAISRMATEGRSPEAGIVALPGLIVVTRPMRPRLDE